MNSQKGNTGVGFLYGVISILLLLGIAGLVVVYSGAYNVAASEAHNALTRWVLTTSMHESVKRRAGNLEEPTPATPAIVVAGAGEYKAMCEHCHGGQGAEQASWASGLRPRPPQLIEAAAEWSTNEVFWLLKYGVKMSAMPAFGPTHDDEVLWNIVAFVKEMPAMTAEKYSTLVTHDEGGHHNGGHSKETHSH